MTPRWEWRAFGAEFGEPEARLRALATTTRESAETYFLTAQSTDNIKIRDGVLDIKVLDATNAAGLERWRPVVKAPFPLPADRVADLLVRLGTHAHVPAGVYGAERLVEELLRVPQIAVLAVEKRRYGSVHDGCLVEIADVRADGRATTTIGVEMEDADRVEATVRALGFDPHKNESYVAAFRRMTFTSPARSLAPRRALS